MLSGIKEIIIVLCVLVGLFIIPRMIRMKSGKADKTTAAASEPPKKNRGLLRMAMLISVLWIAVSFVLLNPFGGDVIPFLGFGVLPVGGGWGIRWVVLGFK